VRQGDPFTACLEEAAETSRMVRDATTETPTGNILMEREPEVAHYRAHFGQDFGAVG